ncbi:hypothetical protein DSL64_22035 [Dyadobacter luteus]|uniref:Secretion system C-terminal sorting domain-containing protein n=1 Tax=Dyadobacter luteus TaxID=2259619 RepID=A0A3D8Y975_9BACT|nr:T9SS type A sorting domain-containing protein [Dyadobacter luteus]REA58067.1 hypothetical protein DSL64_22035 [Dyadobacter luteus]
MKKLLRNFYLTCLATVAMVGVSTAQERLTAIEYRNITIAPDGRSFSMDVWARSVEPAYTTAAAPWETFEIKIDLTLVGGATEVGNPTVTSNGISTSPVVTNNVLGGTGPRLAFSLTRGTGANLTAAAQRLVSVSVPVLNGIVTSASVAATRPSPESPLSRETYWTSSVNPSVFRSLIIPVDTPLPVKLSSFRATKEGSTLAQLNWTTTEEVNSSRFDIERSADSKNWQIIGSVASNGNSTATNSYNFTDVTPLSGINYYRLKMVDLDETFANSSIQTVSFGDFSDRAVSVYPNPVSDVLYLNDANLVSVKQIALVTTDGVTAFQANSINSDGISVKNLSGGLYVVKLTHHDGSSTNHRVLITR